MSRRAEHRRNCRADRSADCRRLTVSEAYLINRMRRLPDDHPSRGMRKHMNKPLRPRMAFPITSEPDQAWRYLRIIRASPTARKLSESLNSHPGPQARCTPEVIMLATFLAAELTGRYFRSDLCAVINGLHATIAYELGLCPDKVFRPVRYSEVEEQVLRLERAPFGRLFPGPEPPTSRYDNTNDDTDDTDDGALSANKVGLIRFNIGVLLESVPKRALAKITSVSLDATAYPTCARTQSYHVQAEVDRAIRDAIERGDPDPVPKGVIIGADGKLQRCKYDPRARTSRRGASSETNHKPDYFTGYFAKLLTAARSYYHSHDRFSLGYDISPYVLALCCDPATDNNALAARELCIALKEVHPVVRTVTSDREFTPSRPFVRTMHLNGIDTIMDYPRPHTKKIDPVTVGQRGEVLYRSCGDLFPLCLPDEHKTLPDPGENTDDETLDWFEDRALWRYVPNGPPDANGTRQYLCAQCAGHLRFAEKTRMGKYRHGNHPGLSLGPPFDQEWCCDGSISIGVEDLDKWQPVPWGTRAHRSLYAAGRNRIENTNNIAKAKGGISKKSCRAPGPIARNMAVLALAVASNVSFADEDPLADPPPDHTPEAELSLFCVLPALGNNGDTQTELSPRAPP